MRSSQYKESNKPTIEKAVNEIYRSESRRILERRFLTKRLAQLE